MFSESNGRVVIESTDYALEISAPEWRLTPEEERQRAQDAADGMNGFMQKLTEAIERQQHGQNDPQTDWDEHDYEKLLKESDARTDKYLELLDKYGDSPEAEEKIAKEIGWLRELTPEEAEEEKPVHRGDEPGVRGGVARAAARTRTAPRGYDWIRTRTAASAHPLQHRCAESATKYWKQADGLGLEKCEDTDLWQFIFEFQATGAKLAGA